MLRRTSAVAGLTATFLAASTVPAWAGGWGSVDCAQDPSPYCQLQAGSGSTQPKPSKPGAVKSQPSTEDAQAQQAAPPPGDHIVGGNSEAAQCSYVRSDYQPPSNGVQTASFRSRSGGGSLVLVAAESSGGAWYVYRCSGEGVRDGLYRAPVWIPDGQSPDAAPLPSPEQLAEQARSQLRLPNPKIVSSPAGAQLVNLPTWLWLDDDSWRAQSATAEVPGVSVTAVARPTTLSWSLGDGTSLTCLGPGTPFPAGGDPAATSPDCGHVYRRSSAGLPNEKFPVTATVHWTVSWSGAGASGTFPDMTTSGAAGLRVAEAQALNTGRS